GTASKSNGNEDLKSSILSSPKPQPFSQGRQGGNGKGNNPTAGQTGSARMVRAPGGFDLGLSGARERSRSVIGARNKPGSPGRFDGAGRHVSRSWGGVECVARESGGGTKKRGSGVVAFPKPRCRLWARF